MHSDPWISSLPARDRVRAFHVIQFAFIRDLVRASTTQALWQHCLAAPPVVIYL
jgi:hypothetical protein